MIRLIAIVSLILVFVSAAEAQKKVRLRQADVSRGGKKRRQAGGLGNW